MSARSRYARYVSWAAGALLTGAAVLACGASAEENPPPPPPPPVDQAAFQKAPRPPAGPASIALPDGGVAAEYWQTDGGDAVDAASDALDAGADAAPDASPSKRRGAKSR